MVRDAWGDPIAAAAAEVILETPTGTTLKTSLVPGLEPGVNYRLAVPMDSGITSDLYKPTALRPLLPFKLRVRIGQTSYLPIEMSGDYSRIGQPGQSTRINLTLGADSDGDGIPDAWEQALIIALGGGLTLADIRPGDDADGDGLSNLDEYLAGTYAFDPADGFNLTISGFTSGGPVLEFLAIRGRTYTIEASSNLERWDPVPFRVLSAGPQAPLVSEYRAPDARIVQVEVPSGSSGPTNRYHRARVQ